MTSELSEYLNEQLGLFLNVKKTNINLTKNIRKDFFGEIFFIYNVILYEIFILFQFWKISYVLLWIIKRISESETLCSYWEI